MTFDIWKRIEDSKHTNTGDERNRPKDFRALLGFGVVES